MSDSPFKTDRLIWLLPAAFSLLLLVALQAGAWAAPSAAQLVYLARLAVRLGFGLGVLLTAWAWFDARTPGRKALWSLGALLAALGVFAYRAADYLAKSDAVARREISVPVALSGTLLLLTLLLTWGWAYQRSKKPSLLFHGASALLVVGVLWLDGLLWHSQAGLVLFVYGVIAVLLSVGLASIPALGRKPARYAAIGLSALVFGFALFSFVLPETAERGRFEAHRGRSSLAHLDARLGGRTQDPNLVSELPAGELGPCKPVEASAEPAGLSLEQRKNVIFISIDTVRADEVSRRHAGKLVMPALNKFMRESWRAKTAYSAYPATMMALSAAFTGLMPSRLLLTHTPPSSVFGALGKAGYERVAVFPDGKYFKRKPIRSYITQGAKHVEKRGAKAQTDAAIKQLKALRKADKPHALWVHYFEPHEPYVAHAEFAFGDSDRERYRSELAHVDVQLGRLLHTLRKGGWYDDSLIVVFSDHGEAFGEHGQHYHHYNLYPWLTQVPFAMRVPGQAPRTFEFPVQLADIAPTVLHFVGKAPELELDGRSLLGPALPQDRPIISEEFPIQMQALERYVKRPASGSKELRKRAADIEFSQGYPSKISLVRGKHQLVVHRSTGVKELYDLKRDPGAQKNLVWGAKAEAESMQQALTAWVQSAAASAGCRISTSSQSAKK